MRGTDTAADRRLAAGTAHDQGSPGLAIDISSERRLSSMMFLCVDTHDGKENLEKTATCEGNSISIYAARRLSDDAQRASTCFG